MGRIRNAWRWLTGSVPTNYGSGKLADGTYITFLRQADGRLVVQTPLALNGRVVVRQANGTYLLA